MPNTANPANKTGLKAKQARIRLVGTEDAPTIYANHVQLNFSKWDIQLVFAQLQTANPKEDMKTKETFVEAKAVVQVYLSPQHFKAMAAMMERNATVHEQRFAVEPDAETKSE